METEALIVAPPAPVRSYIAQAVSAEIAALTLVTPMPRPLSFLDAVVVLAIAGSIHGTSSGVIRACYRLLGRIGEHHRQLIAEMMSQPDPLAHIINFIVTMPDYILTMKPDEAVAQAADQVDEDAIEPDRNSVRIGEIMLVL